MLCLLMFKPAFLNPTRPLGLWIRKAYGRGIMYCSWLIAYSCHLTYSLRGPLDTSADHTRWARHLPEIDRWAFFFPNEAWTCHRACYAGLLNLTVSITTCLFIRGKVITITVTATDCELVGADASENLMLLSALYLTKCIRSSNRGTS